MFKISPYNVFMPEILLRTKLSVPPLRASLVSRPQLIERLNQGLQLGRKLTLISAPAGFGKTTLVCEWVENLRLAMAKKSQINNRCVWLSLDEGDSDPTRFLAYFIAALKQVEGIETTLGEAALSMLQSPQPPPTKVILTSLINEVAEIPDRIVLVLDDYHSIESTSVDDALTFLLENQPPQMHLIIATRDDPNLNISRLRGRGQLTELRAADLRFSASEAAEFLNQVMNLDLSADDVSALETRTEGWIVGLQMAAISMQGRKDTTSLIKSFTGSHRFVLDYLIEEVLNQQTQDIQTFLLQTSVLNRLTGSLCNTLTGREGSQQTLEYLEQANLFIVPLDNERRWYRYHHLFGDLLRVRLQQSQPDQIPLLLMRASKWFEQNGDIYEAIEYALKAEDYDQAATLIEHVADAEWVQEEHKKIWRWLYALPQEFLLSKPYLCFYHAIFLFTSGQPDAAEKSLQDVEKILYPSTKGKGGSTSGKQALILTPDQMKMRGRIASMRAVKAFYQGDLQGITQYAGEAFEFLPEADLFWRSYAADALADAQDLIGDMNASYQARVEALEISKASGIKFHIMISSLKLAKILRDQGRLPQVIDICQKDMQQIDESRFFHPLIQGLILSIWGDVLAEINELDEALQKASKGLEFSEQSVNIVGIGSSSCCLIRVLFSRGDLAGAEEVIHKMNEVSRKYDVSPWIASIIEGWKVRIWLAQGDLDKASQWAEKHRPDPDEEFSHLNEMKYIGLIRILIAQERLEEAIKFLQPLLETEDERGHVWRLIELLILKSLALQTLGEKDQALDVLKTALNYGKQGGFIRIFVDEGPRMARLLYEAAARKIAPDYIQKLLAAFPVPVTEQTNATKSKSLSSELIEHLSDRELEVLCLVAEGVSRQEIASKLFLSLNTVKTHIRNIYSKLGVNNQMQAVGKARALGLLENE